MKPIIDISYYQKPADINYDVVSQNVSGVILRAAYGTGASAWGQGQDPCFNRHYEEFHSRGVPVGAYHYIVQYKTAQEQVDVMRQACAGKELKLGLWCDVEVEAGAELLTRSMVQAYMEKAESALGKFGIYTSASMWKRIMGGAYFTDRKLWVAHYGANSPTLPEGWTSWWLWQTDGTGTGRIEGYNKGIDLNRFFGTQEQWDAWIRQEPFAISLPPYCQRDERWKDEKLGTSSVTIGSYGCLITAMASVCSYFGKSTNPSVLNQDLIRVGGYVQDNLLSFSAIETIYPDVVVNWAYFMLTQSDVSLTDIDALLASGTPVIVQVDYRPLTPEIDQHWVTLIGKDSGGYLLVDPIDGATVNFSRYGVPESNIYRAVVYQGELQPPEEEEVLYKVRVVTGALNIRSGPSISYGKVGILYEGDEVDVLEERDGWLKLGVLRWICGNALYVEKVGMTDKEKLDTLWAWYEESHHG